MREKMREKMIENRGITLIALVITIIVLLILAGVSIGMLTGENGILIQAQKASEENKKASAIEEVQLETAGSFDDNGKYDVNKAIDNLKDNLKIKDEEIINKNGVLTVNYEGYKLYVDTKGKVTEGVTAGVIASDPTSYYGKVISNYECENKDAVEKWKIFYADSENIYLIAGENIAIQYVPDGRKGTKINQSTNFEYLFGLAPYQDYDGAKDILQNKKISKWLSWLEQYPESENINIKTSAYLLDTEAWKGYKGDKGEYAVGGPTLELYIASYNMVNTNRTIDYKIYGISGYQVKWNDVESYTYGPLEEVNTSGNNSIHTGMWIASPHTGPDRNVIWTAYANYKRLYCNNTTTYSAGFRPIVCLKSDVELNEIDGENFEIK